MQCTGVSFQTYLLKYFHRFAFVYSEGESTYRLSDAQTLRVKIIRLAENIDGLR